MSPVDVTRALPLHDQAFLTGDAAGVVRLHALPGGESRRSFHGIEGSAVEHLSFHVESGSVVAATLDGRVGVWDFRSAELRHVLRHEHPVVQAVAWSDRMWISLDSTRVVRRWRRGETELVVEALPAPADQFGVAREPIRGALRDGFAWRSWNPETGQVGERRKVLEPIRLAYEDGALALSDHGDFLFIHWDEGLVVDTRSGEIVHRFPVLFEANGGNVDDAGTRCLVTNREGRLVVVESDGEVFFEREPTASQVIQAELAPSGRLLTRVDARGGVEIWDVEIGEALFADAPKI